MHKLLAPVAAALLLAPTALAQGGWDTVKQRELGLEYKMARDYEAIPVDPLEDFVVLIYQAELPRDEDLRAEYKQYTPRLEFVLIDHSLGVATPTSGEGELPPPPPSDGDDGDGEPEEADEEREAYKPPPPINNLERYVQQRTRGWSLGLPTEHGEDDGYTLTEYEFLPERGKLVGTVYAFSNNARTIALIGSCFDKHHEDQKDIWDAIVKKLKLTEPDTSRQDEEDAKLLKSYERKGYLDPEFRVAARRSLPKGWKADDTDNYIMVYSTKDEPLLRLIKRELEAIRKTYEEMFPPLEPVTAVSRVRICKDQDEYFAYGGPKGSGGYWNWMAEELVFYDYQNVDGEAGTGKANSRIVLYHEAFHQYIHYSAGQLAPHSWFNEGYGDFFSGADVKGSKVKKIGQNPWRNDYIKKVVESDKSVPWKDILFYEQRDYYKRPGLCYAQGWSMIYFLRESKAAQRHEVWSGILDRYFATLRDEYNAGLAELAAEGHDDNHLAVRDMELEALDKAVDVAFADVDFDELEAAWAEFILDL